MTKKQSKYIAYNLWLNKVKWSPEIEHKIFTEIDKSAATDIIGAFKRGDDKMAISRIEHLIGEQLSADMKATVAPLT